MKWIQLFQCDPDHTIAKLPRSIITQDLKGGPEKCQQNVPDRIPDGEPLMSIRVPIAGPKMKYGPAS